MLHIFHMDTGCMLIFETSLAMQPVSYLQENIYTDVGIPPADQVLLVSGGYALDPSQRVVKYSAGNDENPIFLITRTLNLPAQPTSNLNGSNSSRQVRSSNSVSNSCVDVSATITHLRQTLDEYQKIKKDFGLQPAGFDAVVKLIDLARRVEQSTELNANLCYQLTHEQHLLQQGWFAVIANLDDTLKSFSSRVAKFREQYGKYMHRHSDAVQLISDIDANINLLAHIPMLPCLLSNCEPNEKTSGVVSILQWIKSKDSNYDLKDVVVEMQTILNQYGQKIFDDLHDDFLKLLEGCQNKQMKEIAGLGHRLSQLDLNMNKIRQTQVEQHDYFEHLKQQESKMKSCRNDIDFLRSHWVSLSAIVTKMIELLESVFVIGGKFLTAKEELLRNIRARLNWVAKVQEDIGNVDGKIILHMERVRRFRHHVELLRQIRETPIIYGSAVAEVIRRKDFSRQFLEWGHQLSNKMKKLYEHEVGFRQAFARKLERHFLASLFIGMNDLPTLFALESPTLFDQNMPEISDDDIRRLRDVAPQLKSVLRVCKINIYEILKVERPVMPSHLSNPVCREASFFAETPPNYLLTAGTNDVNQTGPEWWSGDGTSSEISVPHSTSPNVAFPMNAGKVAESENFDEEDSNRLKSRQIYPRDVKGPGGFSENDITTVKPIASSSMGSKGFTAPIATPFRSANIVSQQHPVGSVGTLHGYSRDNPMVSSRQMSERSSRFGTPEEELPFGDKFSGDGLVHVNLPLLESPPEIISKSQILEAACQTTFCAEDFAQEDGLTPRSRKISAPKPIGSNFSAFRRSSDTAVSPTQTDIITDLGGMLLEGSSSDSKENSQVVSSTNAFKQQEEVIKPLQQRISELERILSDKDMQLEKTIGELRDMKDKVSCRGDALLKTRKICQEFVNELRGDLADGRSSVTLLRDEVAEFLSSNAQTVLACVPKLEDNLQVSLESAISANLTLQKVEFAEHLKEVESALNVQKAKTIELEKQLDLSRASINEQESFISVLKQQRADETSNWSRRLDEEKKELIKQLTIDNELDMEDVRKECNRIVNEKDNEIACLQSDLHERDTVIAHLRQEQDRLLCSMYEREAVEKHSYPVKTTEEISEEYEQKIAKLTEDYENRLKNVRAEIENSYKDKLTFLQNGLEEKHKAALERCRVEKEFDLRMMREGHKQILDETNRKISTLQQEIEKYKSQACLNCENCGQRTEQLQEDKTKLLDVSTAMSSGFLHQNDVKQLLQESVALHTEESEVQTEEVCVHPTLHSATDNTTQTEDFSGLLPPLPSHNKLCASTSSLKSASLNLKCAVLRDASTQSPMSYPKISVGHPLVDDYVLIVYNGRYQKYLVFTLLVDTLCFLNMNCYKALDLDADITETDSGSPASFAGTSLEPSIKKWVCARVTLVEQCIAKKDKNRFNVPKGTKFYLVGAAPVNLYIIKPEYVSKSVRRGTVLANESLANSCISGSN